MMVSDEIEERFWGSWRILAEGDNFKVKEVFLKPNSAISRHYHEWRSEHWIIVEGSAMIEVNGNTSIVEAGESVFTPMGNPHRVRNPSEEEGLKIIEIQCGEMIEESDIVRLEMWEK